MKKIIFLLIALLVLLSILLGYADKEPKIFARLLDDGVPVEENSNLFIIPNYEIEEMMYPEMYWFGDNLLLFETEYPESEVSETDFDVSDDEYQPSAGIARLKLISIKDGRLLAEREIDTVYTPGVKASEDHIAVYDTFSGKAILLNKRLETVEEYSFEGYALSSAMLDNALENIYVYDYEQTLYRYNLADGKKEKVLEGGWLYPFSHTDNNCFSYVDMETQRYNYGCIDAETGAVGDLPSDLPADFCDRSGSAWLMRNRYDYCEYELISEGEEYEIIAEAQNVFLSDNGHLILCNDSCSETAVYNIDGSFVSSFSFDAEYEHTFDPNSFLWSDLYNGYLFADNFEGSTALMFFDPNIVTSGSDLPLKRKNDELPAGKILEPELYERAAQLSEKYDLDIRIGEQCELDYNERYRGVEIMTENDRARNALDILEGALECYPEGFFSQLKYCDVSEIRIEIVAYLPSAAGFAQHKDDHCLVALDGICLTDYFVFHEFSHIIDNRLAWDSMLREEAIYSEAQWFALQPEGFEYANTYDVSLEFRDEYFDPSYFVMPYALTFPTEDRAVLMGTAMDEDYAPFFIKEDGEPEKGLHEKLEYYSNCIRDCFDTDGWPEVTEWEKLL